MDLKKRLILANAATVIIPVFITVLIALAVFFIYGKLTLSDKTMDNFERTIQAELEVRESIRSVLQEKPEMVEDVNFQRHLQDKLAPYQGEILIVKKGAVIFASRELNQIEIDKCLSPEDPGKGISQQIVLADNTYVIRNISFIFQDGKQGKAVILLPVNKAMVQLKTIIISLGLLFLVLYAGTSIIVSLHFSRSIIKPLNNLQKAAGEISKGNLDYQIVEEGDEEIRALCRKLEIMRIKLKELIHTQLKYEENRKMLVSSISHDLKTPVTSIKGYVEGIFDGIANTPEKMDKYLKTIYTKARQVDTMIDDLLLYAKLDLNQIPFNFEPTDIEEYMHDCISECEPEMERRQVIISLHSELKQRYILPIDRERMRRVIMNILDNSCKYMGREKGEIQVLLRETFSSVIIELKDNGTGISSKDLPHIFDRFYRSDAARSQGSGLGLAIAKQIVEGHNGRIWAVSHKDGGTGIIISLAINSSGKSEKTEIGYEGKKDEFE